MEELSLFKNNITVSEPYNEDHLIKLEYGKKNQVYY